MNYLVLKNWIFRILDWGSRIAVWVSEPWRAWVALAMIVLIPVVCSKLFSEWEQGFRIAGMILELLGLSTVALGLHQTRKLFQRPGFRALLAHWVRRFPRFRVDTVVSVPAAEMKMTGLVPSVRVVASASSRATIEERIGSLENRLSEANDQIEQITLAIEEEGGSRRSAQHAEQQHRIEGERQVRKLIEETAAGGLYLESIGVLWLLFGVILATSSAELVCLLRLK